jgi:hypothetical protein
MDERFIDDLARTIATPMSRSRALRLIGTIVVGAFLQWPRRAYAYASCANVKCPSPTDPTRPQLCCFDNGVGSINTCCKATESCCKTASTVTCCQPGEACGIGNTKQAICIPCPSGATPCGSLCCQPGQTCGVGVDGSPKCGTCPSGQTLCGTKCCSGSCINPASGCCGSGIACGKTCCDPGTTCINTAQGLSCCPVGQSRLVLKSTILWSRAIYLCCNKGDMVLDGVECCPVNRIVAATPIADLKSRGSILSEGTRQRTHFCCPVGSVPRGSCCSIGGKPCRCDGCPAGFFCVNQQCVRPPV